MQAFQTLKFVKKAPPRWSVGSLFTPAGEVYRISSRWSRADHWGMIRSRTGAYRMNYAVPPGLYAVGEPTSVSDVFVSANYKLSFDILRRELKGMNAWVLVLDTKSINVWCAAGKGTFGTDELIRRISAAKLETIVSHRRIILPQLGAPGVSAGAVQKATGFRVSYGPVDARDITAYVEAGYRKTPEMSTIKFPMKDRLILTPMEINPAIRKFRWIAPVVFLVFGLEPSGILFRQAWFNGMPFLLLAFLSVLAGALITPVLLPFIPFRSFALKGWIVGVIAVFAATSATEYAAEADRMLLAAAYLLFPALSSYVALQFTGATTFTGMTGVKKELKIGIPAFFGAAGVSLVLIVLYKIREWGLI